MVCPSGGRQCSKIRCKPARGLLAVVQSHSLAHAFDVGIHRLGGHAKSKQQHARSRLVTDSLYARQLRASFGYRQIREFGQIARGGNSQCALNRRCLLTRKPRKSNRRCDILYRRLSHQFPIRVLRAEIGIGTRRACIGGVLRQNRENQLANWIASRADFGLSILLAKSIPNLADLRAKFTRNRTQLLSCVDCTGLRHASE